MTAKRTEKRDDKMLTAKEAAFVAAYITDPDGNQTRAAKAAGFSSAQGLMKRPHVRKEIGKRMNKAMAKKQITAERVVEELGKIAFANIDDFVDDEYRIEDKPSRKKMAAVQEVTTETLLAPLDKDGNPLPGKDDVKRVKLKMYSKLDALDKLGRHFKLFTDKVELSGGLAERMERAYAKLEEGSAPVDRANARAQEPEPCEGCGDGDKVPATGYWKCPVCDAEWEDE